MISPVSLYQELQSQRKYLRDLDTAEKYFSAQREAIRAIKDTQGFQEIKLFWFREWEACIDRIRTAKWTDLQDAQSRLAISQSFIDFMDNLLS